MLNTYRAKVLEALGTVSAHQDALALLGVGASLRADVERNTRLHAEPAAPAHQVYSGRPVRRPGLQVDDAGAAAEGR